MNYAPQSHTPNCNALKTVRLRAEVSYTHSVNWGETQSCLTGASTSAMNADCRSKSANWLLHTRNTFGQRGKEQLHSIFKARLKMC